MNCCRGADPQAHAGVPAGAAHAAAELAREQASPRCALLLRRLWPVGWITLNRLVCLSTLHNSSRAGKLMVLAQPPSNS